MRILFASLQNSSSGPPSLLRIVLRLLPWKSADDSFNFNMLLSLVSDRFFGRAVAGLLFSGSNVDAVIVGLAIMFAGLSKTQLQDAGWGTA